MSNPALNPIIVHRGRTASVRVNLSRNITGSTFTSQIRKTADADSELIATWTVNFATDGSDGTLILTMDNLITAGITFKNGFMDLKEIKAGEPMAVFNEPIPVIIRETVTQ